MPIYLYNCQACGKTEEYFLDIGRKPYRCISCEERGPLKRVYDQQTISMQMDSERSGSSNQDIDLSKLECLACGNPISKHIFTGEEN